MRFQCKTTLRNTVPFPCTTGWVKKGRYGEGIPLQHPALFYMCILRSFSKVLCRNLQFSFLLFAIIVCCSYCSYFHFGIICFSRHNCCALAFWFILFAHLEFALNVSMVIFCGRAMTGAGNASHRAGPRWIQLTSTGGTGHTVCNADGGARTQRCWLCAPTRAATAATAHRVPGRLGYSSNHMQGGGELVMLSMFYPAPSLPAYGFL